MGLADEHGLPIIDPENGKKTREQGASTQTWLATIPRLAGLGGVYGENNEISPVVELPAHDALQALVASGQTPVGVVPHAIDPEAAERLWELSDRLIRQRSAQ